MTFVSPRPWHRVISCLVALFAITMGSTVAAHAQSTVTAPDQLPRLFAEAMAARDAGRLASFYGERAVLMTPEGPVASGRDQIRTLFTRNLSAGPVKMTFNQARLDGDQANAVMLWDWTLEVMIAGRDPIRRRVRSMLHLKNTATGWEIMADMYQILPSS